VTSHIAIASCDALLPDGAQDDVVLAAALSERGAEVTIASWSDPAVDWSSFDRTVVRSTWDYPLRRPEFLAWLAAVPRLDNPASVVISNTDKRYLRDLAAAGLPVVPTTFVEPGEAAILPSEGEFVVKPTVGAGSRGAGRFDLDQVAERERAAEHLDHLHAEGRTAMIQPYLTDVDTVGETGLIFIDGVFSHAIRKGRMLAEGASYRTDESTLYIEEDISARTPSAGEVEVAEKILANLTSNGPLLYARIDLLPSTNGPLLVEAELAEPSLFLEYRDDSAALLADAILARAMRTP
jgi:glutathione synthase/RimK-type ligase-like ATP-grasp enzyme